MRFKKLFHKRGGDSKRAASPNLFSFTLEEYAFLNSAILCFHYPEILRVCQLYGIFGGAAGAVVIAFVQNVF